MIDCNLKYNRDRERETQEFLLMHYVRTSIILYTYLDRIFTYLILYWCTCI